MPSVTASDGSASRATSTPFSVPSSTQATTTGGTAIQIGSAELGELREEHRAEGERRGERDVDLAEDDDHRETEREDAGIDEVPGREAIWSRLR